MEATFKYKGHDSPSPVLCPICACSLKTDFTKVWCECTEPTTEPESEFSEDKV